MNTAKLINQSDKTNLVIAHKAGSSPFYYVEEADITGNKVSVSFFNENDPASDIQNLNIPTKVLIDFTNEFYRDYVDFEVAGVHVQERIAKAGIDYLKENLNSVLTDYLNANHND